MRKQHNKKWALLICLFIVSLCVSFAHARTLLPTTNPPPTNGVQLGVTTGNGAQNNYTPAARTLTGTTISASDTGTGRLGDRITLQSSTLPNAARTTIECTGINAATGGWDFTNAGAQGLCITGTASQPATLSDFVITRQPCTPSSLSETHFEMKSYCVYDAAGNLLDTPSGITGDTADDMFRIEGNASGYLEYQNHDSIFWLENRSNRTIMIPSGPGTGANQFTDYERFMANAPSTHIATEKGCYPIDVTICASPVLAAIDGACGSANSTTVTSTSSISSSDQCTTGTASSFTTTATADPRYSTISWNCTSPDAATGGINATCQATLDNGAVTPPPPPPDPTKEPKAAYCDYVGPKDVMYIIDDSASMSATTDLTEFPPHTRMSLTRQHIREIFLAHTEHEISKGGNSKNKIGMMNLLDGTYNISPDYFFNSRITGGYPGNWTYEYREWSDLSNSAYYDNYLEVYESKINDRTDIGNTAGTPLFYTIQQAANLLGNGDPNEPNLIVVLTDGADDPQNPTVTVGLQDTIDLVNGYTNLKLHIINVGTHSSNVKRLAEDTGGFYGQPSTSFELKSFYNDLIFGCDDGVTATATLACGDAHKQTYVFDTGKYSAIDEQMKDLPLCEGGLASTPVVPSISPSVTSYNASWTCFERTDPSVTVNCDTTFKMPAPTCPAKQLTASEAGSSSRTNATLCAHGQPTQPSYNIDEARYEWRCFVSNTSNYVSCESKPDNNGFCGYAFRQSFTTEADLRAAGACVPSSPIYLDSITLSGSSWRWKCVRPDNSLDSCTARKYTVVTSGPGGNFCGTAHGGVYPNQAAFNAANQCKAGSSLQNMRAGGNGWKWSCKSGSQSSSCNAAKDTL